MQHHVSERRIRIVAVGLPVHRSQIDLNIPLNRRRVANLNYRSAKIRACFVIPKSRMQDTNAFAIESDQAIPQETLMKPSRLKQVFRRRVGTFEERKLPRRLLTPFRV